MNTEKAIMYVRQKLQNELPSKLWYHSLNHTIDVVDAAVRLADLEEIAPHQKRLLEVAAWYHDVGFVKQYKDNEPIAAEMARESLPEFGFSEADIDIVCGCIMATRLPQSPQTLLERIICDADLDYLGRGDFFIIAHTLRREWKEYGFFNKTLLEWYQLQDKFLSGHDYHTTAAKKLRNQQKAEHHKEVKLLLMGEENQI